MNKQGLKNLHWELFDSPDEPGSGFKFMEREPVLILDDIIVEHTLYKPKIIMGYTSQKYADLRGLPSSSSHRTGHAVLLRVTNAKKRMFLVRHLILRGVQRIGIGQEHVYFDTDLYLKGPRLYYQ